MDFSEMVEKEINTSAQKKLSALQFKDQFETMEKSLNTPNVKKLS